MRVLAGVAAMMLAAWSLLASGCSDGAPTYSESTGTVRGVVSTEGATGDFTLSGAQVWIGTISDTTDEQGAYQLDGVPPGQQTIHATHVDFVDYSTTVAVAVGAVTHDITLVREAAR